MENLTYRRVDNSIKFYPRRSNHVTLSLIIHPDREKLKITMGSFSCIHKLQHNWKMVRYPTFPNPLLNAHEILLIPSLTRNQSNILPILSIPDVMLHQVGLILRGGISYKGWSASIFMKCHERISL